MATTSTCSQCNQVFASVAAFEAHRVGSFGEPLYKVSRSGRSRHVYTHLPVARRCLTVQEMLDKGMAKNDKDRWMLPGLNGAEMQEEST